VIGENFDKEQISPALLEDVFVRYSTLIEHLPLHLLFTLPVPFVNRFGGHLRAFGAAHPIYDVPVFDHDHRPHKAGRAALLELLQKRADVDRIFAKDALDLLLSASGGDLYLLFGLIEEASRRARYRHEPDPATLLKILRSDVVPVLQEQIGVFRSRLGTAPNDTDTTDWETKRRKLRDLYEGKPNAAIPDPALYQLLYRRAVLFFQGGRYGVHPLAVQILREQFKTDTDFQYKGGGLDMEVES
jgi:hypothetical protein